MASCFPGKELPSKLSDSTQLFQPMIDMMLSSVASFAPNQQGAAASQNPLKLETELEKRKQQLRQQGVMLTPEKPATKSADKASGSLALPIAGQEPSQQKSPTVQARQHPGRSIKNHIKKLQGQSFLAAQSWAKTFKKNLGANKLSMLSLRSLQWRLLLRLTMPTTSLAKIKPRTCHQTWTADEYYQQDGS